MKLILLALLLAACWLPALAPATGTPPAPAAPTQNVVVSPTAQGEMKAYGLGAGGTGLTSTAECLGSKALLFNFAATTYTEPGCVIRHYSKICKDAACRQALMCLDPDLIDEAKAALGCPPPKPK